MSILSSLFESAKVRAHPGAFIAAAILTPILFALSGIVFFFYGVVITAYAAVLGLPAMILLGLPCAYLVITRRPAQDGLASLGDITMSGLAANFLAFPFGVLVIAVLGEPISDAIQVVLFYCGCGLIAAPVEALIFGLLYRTFAPPPTLVVDAEVFC